MEMLGVPIDDVTRDGALTRIGLFLEDGRQHLVTTPNPEMVVDAQKDTLFLAALRKSDLAIPDGIGLVRMARFLGEPLSERVTGTDLVDDIAGLATQKKRTLFLLGSVDGIAARAARRLQLAHPGLAVVGAESGGKVVVGSDGIPKIADAVLARIRDAAPDILFVAFGHGTQEKWLVENIGSFPSVKVAVGIGGAFDFIAGTARRAPSLFRMVGLEWLWRFVTQPWRWRRILKAVVVFPYLVMRSSR